MDTALIIHGAYGNPRQNWFPWTSRKLERLDYTTFTPQFPTPEGQNVNSWISIVAPYLAKLNQNSLLIGHSIGATFALSVLEQLATPLKATFFVSGFIGNLNHPELDTINTSFYQKPFDWATIRRNAGQIIIFHSDNDPFVPLHRCLELSTNLGTKPIIIPGAGHFNTASDYRQFPQLFSKIEQLVTTKRSS